SRTGFSASPRYCSDKPGELPYVSAVSEKVIPASTAACTTRIASPASAFAELGRRRVLQPKPTAETTNPESPTRRNFMVSALRCSNDLLESPFFVQPEKPTS